MYHKTISLWYSNCTWIRLTHFRDLSISKQCKVLRLRGIDNFLSDAAELMLSMYRVLDSNVSGANLRRNYSVFMCSSEIFDPIPHMSVTGSVAMGHFVYGIDPVYGIDLVHHEPNLAHSSYSELSRCHTSSQQYCGSVALNSGTASCTPRSVGRVPDVLTASASSQVAVHSLRIVPHLLHPSAQLGRCSHYIPDHLNSALWTRYF